MKKKTLPGKNTPLWSARDLLLAQCQTCFRMLTWRPDIEQKQFHASCCRLAFQATPLHDAKRFHVTIYDVDPTNLVIISDYE